MLKQFRNSIAALLFLAALLVVPLATAATSDTTTTNSGSSTTKTTSDSSSSTSTTDDGSEDKAPDPTVLKTRLEARKTEFKIKLVAAEELKIKGKCKAGQAVVKTLHDKIAENVTTRTTAYQNLLDRLNSLVTKLKASNVDTTTLEAQIKTLSGKIDTYKSNLKDYRQALTDLQSVDCVTDPAAFKAALENARSKRETLSKTVLDIRTYVQGTIKPTLVTIRTTMEAKEKTDADTTTSTNGGTQ